MSSMMKRFTLVSAVLFALAVFSIFVNPEKSLALSWEQVGTSGLGGGAANQTVYKLVDFNDKLYASIGNGVTGVKIFSSTDGVTWTQVNTDGFGTATNVDAPMAVYDSALYVATMSQGLLPGELTQLWKTTNGTSWTQVGTDGFGDAFNIGVVAMSEFNGNLYLGTLNAVTGAEVFQLDSADVLTQVNSDGFGDGNNLDVWSLGEYSGALYAGTEDQINGAQLWKTTNGTSWSKVMDGGFGDVNNIRITTLFNFGGDLYAGTLNGATGTEVWRTTISDSTWEQVNTDGFGNAGTYWAGDQAAIVNGTIYLGTRNNAVDEGAKLFTSTNGSAWTQEGADGFGDPGNNFAMYAVTFNGRIFLGISSMTGAEIWRTGTIGTLSIPTTSLADGTVNSTYSATVGLENGTSPFTYSLIGSLPDGLSLNYSTGEISGTPTKDGTFTFTISVLDAGAPQQMASREFSIKINALATATPTPEVLPETGGNLYLNWANHLI